MSHYTEIKVDFDQKYEKELIEALREQFGEDGVEVHKEPVGLKLYNGTSALGNTGLGKTNKCHLIIRQDAQSKKAGHRVLSNDAGYERTDDGKYRAFIDAAGFSTQLQGLVAQSYAVRVSEKKLKAEGYMTKRVLKEDGTIRLEARIYS